MATLTTLIFAFVVVVVVMWTRTNNLSSLKATPFPLSLSLKILLRDGRTKIIFCSNVMPIWCDGRAQTLKANPNSSFSTQDQE